MLLCKHVQPSLPRHPSPLPPAPAAQGGPAWCRAPTSPPHPCGHGRGRGRGHGRRGHGRGRHGRQSRVQSRRAQRAQERQPCSAGQHRGHRGVLSGAPGHGRQLHERPTCVGAPLPRPEPRFRANKCAVRLLDTAAAPSEARAHQHRRPARQPPHSPTRTAWLRVNAAEQLKEAVAVTRVAFGLAAAQAGSGPVASFTACRLGSSKIAHYTSHQRLRLRISSRFSPLHKHPPQPCPTWWFTSSSRIALYTSRVRVYINA